MSRSLSRSAAPSPRFWAKAEAIGAVCVAKEAADDSRGLALKLAFAFFPFFSSSSCGERREKGKVMSPDIEKLRPGPQLESRHCAFLVLLSTSS